MSISCWRCGHTVEIVPSNTTAVHWKCKCGMTSEGEKYTVDIDYKIAEAKKIMEELAYVIDLAEQKNPAPPVTGRPFMKGVWEPEIGQVVWYHAVLGKLTEQCVEFAEEESNWQMDMLRRGELYPTEQDCIEGEKRKEICLMYEALGDGFIDGGTNVCAHYNHLIKNVYPSEIVFHTAGAVYFRTQERCQDAIDKINELYGPGAFEHYYLG